jgi:hypothetical protein
MSRSQMYWHETAALDRPCRARTRFLEARGNLLAMQKVERSNPFSRSRQSGSTEPQTVPRRPCWPLSFEAISGPGA